MNLRVAPRNWPPNAPILHYTCSITTSEDWVIREKSPVIAKRADPSDLVTVKVDLIEPFGYSLVTLGVRRKWLGGVNQLENSAASYFRYPRFLRLAFPH